jgi:type IV pilus assembly protein PilW
MFTARLRPHAARTSRGLSLVEVMVSLAIGLVVVGAVFANYLHNSVGARQAKALGQVTEDASLAMGILRNHLAMADYSEPTDIGAKVMTKRLTGITVLGCSNGFATNPADIGSATCKTAAGSDALRIRYQADMHNSVPTVGSGTKPSAPTDCGGNGLTAETGTTDFFVADNRFELTSSAPISLGCNGDPLVENVTEMHFTYGVAATDASTTKPGRIMYYVPASGVQQTGEALDVAWAKVVAVRICLVVQSADEVLSAATPYRDCVGDIQTPTDRRIHRAFTSTVVLNNRLASN